MDNDYKYALKCIFNAHDSDVRVIKSTSIPNDGILTGSRDKSVKVWSPKRKSYEECHVFLGATKSISSSCVLPPSAQYPKGLFLAGCNDSSIYGFTPDSSEPVLRLLGHSATVCSLSYGKFGFLVSGSWDKTARVWSGQQCVLTLQGHLEAVWTTDVFPTQNLILTGSADHTIRLWRSGVCEKVFRGHEGCVSGLAIVSEMKFLSCSYDTTVRLWLTSGQCLHIFKSHCDYIYSISLLSNGAFATCGEDQYIKIWLKKKLIQTLLIPEKSAWSLACLSNKDIAVGTSSGKVYIYQKVPMDYSESEFSPRSGQRHHSYVPKLNFVRAGQASGRPGAGLQNSWQRRPGTHLHRPQTDEVLGVQHQGVSNKNNSWITKRKPPQQTTAIRQTDLVRQKELKSPQSSLSKGALTVATQQRGTPQQVRMKPTGAVTDAEMTIVKQQQVQQMMHHIESWSSVDRRSSLHNPSAVFQFFPSTSLSGSASHFSRGGTSYVNSLEGDKFSSFAKQPGPVVSSLNSHGSSIESISISDIDGPSFTRKMNITYIKKN